jgi:hypothetical protein
VTSDVSAGSAAMSRGGHWSVGALLLAGERGAVAEDEGSTIVWKKSSKSNSGSCVEVAFVSGTVLIRDSRNADGGVLATSPMAWIVFLTRVREAGFELRPG